MWCDDKEEEAEWQQTSSSPVRGFCVCMAYVCGGVRQTGCYSNRQYGEFVRIERFLPWDSLLCPNYQRKPALYVPFSSQQYHLPGVHLQRLLILVQGGGEPRSNPTQSLWSSQGGPSALGPTAVPYRFDTQTVGSGWSNFCISLFGKENVNTSQKSFQQSECIILYSHTKQIFSGLRAGDKEINFGQECFHRNRFCSLTTVSSYCWVFFSSSSFVVKWRVRAQALLQRVNSSVLPVGSNPGTVLAPKLIVDICRLSQAETM